MSAVAGATPRRATTDPLAVRVLLTGAALLFVALFIVLPLATIFAGALAKGAGVFWEAVRDSETLFSVRLTLLVTIVVVAANLVFGLAAAWSITRFRFKGRRLLSSLIELPLSVSPVVAGLVFILLLDEPFGSLDARVRRELRLWLRRLHDELHVTSVFVTHDQEEALEVADRVVLMNAGRIEQIGTPQEVWEHPRTPFVLDFLGSVNLFHGRVHHGRLRIGGMEIDVPEHAGTHAAAAVGYVRDHELDVSRADGKDAGLASTVLQVRRLGPVVRLELRRLDTAETFEAALSAERFCRLDLLPGETVFVRPRRVRVFVDS